MQRHFLLNILFSIIWVAVTGEPTFVNFFFGFILSFFIMWAVSARSKDQRYFRLIPKVISLVFYFFFELIKANLQVAFDVSTPHYFMKPAIVAVPLDIKSDLGITILANLITLTPGTLSLDVSDDRKTLYVHAMYVFDKKEFVKHIKNGFERRLLSIMQ
ncbi:MAG: Na+/H+ antiporter subunit E [Saprospirales bacterium]|nr:MAG: Na+/H+ antiporter subunit E [Saprospirales bacterium]